MNVNDDAKLVENYLASHPYNTYLIAPNGLLIPMGVE